MNHRPVNRRDLIKVAGAGSVVLAAGTRPGIATLAQEATPAGDASTPGGELVIGKALEAVGYDPAVVTATSSMEFLAVVYQRLVRFDDEGQPQPELAESWDTSDDLTYVFTLRQGVMFQNGQPLTAEDVKFTFDRIQDPATSSSWATQFEPVETIEATDDRTVTFRLSAPYGPFLATLSSIYSSIVPMTSEPTDFQTTMIGTGAFALAEAQPDTQTTLTAHPDYWESGLPQLGTLTYRILPDEATRLASIRTGEIGLTTLADPVSVDAAASSEGVQVLEQDTTDYYLLGFNCARPPFDNQQVRQALSMAIDRQAIVDAVFFGNGQVTGPIVPTLGDWAQPVDQLPTYAVNREDAASMLEEAGQAGVTFRILVGQLYPEFVNIALVIQDQLKEIGVNAELEQVEWATFIERWRARDFDAFVSFNGSGNDPDRALYPAFYTDGSVNAFQFSDPEVDELLDAGRTTPDRETRRATYQQLEVAIAEAAPAVFISTRTAYYAVRDNVTGFAPSASQSWETLKQTTVS
jgi:peptide/nickel transport system substrate-binding protein